MRILIVGGGDVGYALSRRLASAHDITVLEHNPKVAEQFTALDVEVVIGSGTDPSTLRRAGIARAELLVASTGFDEVNLVACTVGRQLGSPATICLVSRDDFFGPFAAGDALQRHFGVDRVLWPEAQLAADIERSDSNRRQAEQGCSI
jgi:trk system potassium uptake protein TrkA